MRIFYILVSLLVFTFAAQSQERVSSNLRGAGPNRIIKFYPNPAVTFIHFEFQQAYSSNLNLQIINFLGKKVLEINNLSSQTTVNLADLYRGVYIFQLRDPSGKMIESGKFQISK